jgi:hypothetical protein
LLIVFAVSLMVIPIGIQQPGALTFTLFAWMLLVLVVLRRRRAAAIFTSDSLYVRPWLGLTERFSLKGIKRAYIHPGTTDEDAPSVRIVLLVGGEIKVGVPQMERVVYLLNKGAGKGLEIPNTSADRTADKPAAQSE